MQAKAGTLWIDLALRDKRISGPQERFILWVLHCRRHGGLDMPSSFVPVRVDDLGFWTGYARSTIMAALASLKAKGYLEISGAFPGDRVTLRRTVPDLAQYARLKVVGQKREVVKRIIKANDREALTDIREDVAMWPVVASDPAVFAAFEFRLEALGGWDE